MLPTPSWTLESPTDQTFDLFDDLHEHWRRWEIASCEEWTSGHLWVASLYMDDEGYGPEIDVYCTKCPATLHDLYQDYHDLLYGTLDDVVIDNGRFEYTEDKDFQVNVKLHVETYTSMDFIGPEYDVWIELTKKEQP